MILKKDVTVQQSEVEIATPYYGVAGFDNSQYFGLISEDCAITLFHYDERYSITINNHLSKYDTDDVLKSTSITKEEFEAKLSEALSKFKV